MAADQVGENGAAKNRKRTLRLSARGVLTTDIVVDSEEEGAAGVVVVATVGKAQSVAVEVGIEAETNNRQHNNFAAGIIGRIRTM
jgi:hypothetical protein